jgi:hypothetical protein
MKIPTKITISLIAALGMGIILPVISQQRDERIDHIKQQWARSLHAGSMDTPEERKRMNRPGCAHCHTAQGYRREILEGKESAAPYDDAEGITCAACHNPDRLEVGDPALRAGRAERACTGCHDILVQNDERGFDSCLQGAMLRGERGGEFAGSDYPTGTHSSVALNCVGCHMASPPAGDAGLNVGGHTFRVITKGESPRLFNPRMCLNCHDPMVLADVTESQAEVRRLMQELRSLLPRQEDGEPRFPKDPSLSSIESKGAFNYYFILKDGTWGVHNPPYIRRLLQDSIAALRQP